MDAAVAPRPPDHARALVVRPCAPGDAEAVARMFRRLSPTTVHRRFFSIPDASPDAAAVLAAEHDRHEVVVAAAGTEVVGVARYERLPGGDDADFAVMVEDAWQGSGVGRALMRWTAALAAARGVSALTFSVLGENRGAISAFRRCFPQAQVRRVDDEVLFRVELPRRRP